MKMTMLCLTVALAGLEAQGRSLISCQTTSNGRFFQNFSRSSEFSRQQALSECQNDRDTNDRECEVNLACSDSVAGRYVGCHTVSQGRTFSNTSRSSEFSRQQALSECQNDRDTDSRECEVNLGCSDNSQVLIVPGVLRY